MESKGRIPFPPHHMRHPLSGPGMGHPEPFEAGMRAPPGGFPREMLPHAEMLEQKIAAQNVELDRLVTENRRLAATHGTLRQQLAAAQQELQMLDSRIGGAKSEREQQMRGLVEKISKMEAELKAAERLKQELQQAKTEAQSLTEVRQELMTKMQQLTADLQRAHVDGQQIPAMLAELDHLRQEFHHCRVTYDHERKVYREHLESRQLMEKEYAAMADEVAKLRAELNNTASIDNRAAYGGVTGYGENDAFGNNPSGKSSYEDGYKVPQVHAQYPMSGAAATTSVAAGGGGGTPTYTAPQSGPTAAARAGYDASQRGPTYDVSQRGPAYDPSRGPTYDPHQVGSQSQLYTAQRLSGYDAYRGAGYDMQRAAAYDPQRAAAAAAAAYEMPMPPRGTSYDAHSRVGAHAAAPAAPPPLGGAPASAAPSAARPGTGHEAQPRGGNAAARR